MRLKTLWLLLAVAVVALFFIFRSLNSMEPFVIMPEPSFPLRDNYAIDEEAMRSYYADLFQGKSAADVIKLLEKYDVMYLFEGGNRIDFLVAKGFGPIPARYSGNIVIEFKDGVFEKVVSFGVFGIDAL